MANAFDYQPDQKAQARIFGGWKQVTVEETSVTGTWIRVCHEHGANKRSVTIYDPRLIRPCPAKKSPLTCPDQLSLDS